MPVSDLANCLSMPPSFRSATQADAEASAQVYLSSRQRFVAFALVAYSDQEVCQGIRDSLIPNGQVTVVGQSDRIIGLMALSKADATGWIAQLYLHLDAIGLGIGTQRVEYAKAELGAPIRLYTFQQNRGAVKFYEQHEFTVVRYRDGSQNEENCPDILYK